MQNDYLEKEINQLECDAIALEKKFRTGNESTLSAFDGEKIMRMIAMLAFYIRETRNHVGLSL